MLRIRIVLVIVFCGLGGLLVATEHPPAEPPIIVSSRTIKQDYVPPVFIGYSDAELDILDTLEQKASIDFTDKPLGEVLAALSLRHEISINVEEDSLDEADNPLDRKITIKQKGRKLRTILSKILSPHGLSWFVYDDAVGVTGNLYCLRNEVAIYPVGDFMRNGCDLDEISELIQINTDAMWEDIDGSGGFIRHVRGTKSLVIAQPQYAQYEIIEFLACLRAARRISGELAVQKK